MGFDRDTKMNSDGDVSDQETDEESNVEDTEGEDQEEEAEDQVADSAEDEDMEDEEQEEEEEPEQPKAKVAVAAAAKLPPKAKTATAVGPSRSAKPKPGSKNAATYEEMILHAIKELNDRSGSSRQAILKFLKEHHNLGDNEQRIVLNVNNALKKRLRKGYVQAP